MNISLLFQPISHAAPRRRRLACYHPPPFETGSTRAHGFTLLELLLVIAGIAILAALLMAVMSRARESARRTQCAGNLRQLGLALLEYKIDYNSYPQEHFTPLLPGIWGNAWRASLEHQLNPRYTRGPFTSHVWHCPSAYRPSNFPPQVGYADYGYNVHGAILSASTNSLGLGEKTIWKGIIGTPDPPDLPVREIEVALPSEMIALGDGFHGTAEVIQDGTTWLCRQSDLGPSMAFNGYNFTESTRRAYARHQNRVQVIFCDGHFESPSLRNLFADANDQALSRWNRDHQPHRELLP